MANEKKQKGHKQVNLNIRELKSRLGYLIENNRELQKRGMTPLAFGIEGLSGLGKTSTVLQLADELKLGFYKLNLAQIEEIGDLVGFPIRQFEVCKGDECSWIDEPAIETYTSTGYTFTGKNRMGYCPPFWISGIKEGGLLILDDWTRADTRFIQAVMELIDRQTYISWKLPKDWHIILTSNPDDGNYFVNATDDAQRTRYIGFNLVWDKSCWAEWAERAKVDGRCINFLLKHPELIKQELNARSATNFFNAISSLPNFGTEEALSLITDIGEGSVGPEFTSMFTMFIHNKLDKLISPEEIFSPSKTDKVIIDVLEDCIGKGKDYRADIASLISTRMRNYTISKAEKDKKSIDKAYITRLVEIIKSKVIASDLSYVIIRDIFNSDTKTFQGLTSDKEITKIILA